MLSNFAFLDFGLPEVFISIVVLVVFGFEIAMFISAARNRQISSNARILWCVAMLLIHPFVAVAYYFTDYQKTK